MTLRVAFIGNSHAGALRAALADEPGLLGDQIAPTFLMAKGNDPYELKCDGHTIVPQTEAVQEQFRTFSDGLDVMDTHAHDAFVLVGLTWFIPRARHGITSQFLDEIVEHRVATAMNFVWARALRKLTDKPIYASPHPMALNPLQPGDYVSYRDIFDRFVARTADLNLTLLRQPLKTRENDLVTKLIYQRELDGKRDNFHMNGAYGAVCLNAIRQHLTRDLLHPMSDQSSSA